MSKTDQFLKCGVPTVGVEVVLVVVDGPPVLAGEPDVVGDLVNVLRIRPDCAARFVEGHLIVVVKGYCIVLGKGPHDVS